MSDILSPTKERLAKSPHWDRPENNQQTERKATRNVDPVMMAWRKGSLEYAHLQAWERFQRHVEGVQGHDVRVTDATGEQSEASERMPAWQHHGMKLAEARTVLSSDQFQALELMVYGWGLREVGLNFSPYKGRNMPDAFALGFITPALDLLAILWAIKLRARVPIRGD